MTKVLYILPVLLLSFLFSFSQTPKGLSFYRQYVGAQVLIETSLKVNDLEKAFLFLNEANHYTMNAKTLFKDLKSKLTPKEADDMELALDFLLNISGKEYLDDSDRMKLVMWFRLNDRKQEKAIAKLLK